MSDAHGTEDRQLIDAVTSLSAPAGAALAMHAKLGPLAKFGALVLDEHRGDLGDVDGGWLQEKAVECGLLERVEVTAENMCRKASNMGQMEADVPYCICEIGDDCYRRTEASKAMDRE